VRTISVVFILFLGSMTVAMGTPLPQARSTPSLELLQNAQLSDVRSVDGSSFQLHAKIRLAQDQGSEIEGSYSLVWASSAQWREEFVFPDFNQVRVSGQGGIWEKREPSYLSLRVWQLMQALAFYGRLDLQHEESAAKIRVKKRNGTSLRCIEIMRRDHGMEMTVRELCFSADAAQLVSEHYVPSDRTYEFSDYLGVGTKFFPRHVKVYDGKTLAADFSVAELKEANNASSEQFEKPAQAEWRAWCASPEAGGDPLTPIYSRFVQKKGEATLYGAIGPDGLWNGLHVLEPGGPDHDSEVLEALKRERWKPSSCNGVPIVIETVFKR
jgi:hypothetical protein